MALSERNPGIKCSLSVDARRCNRFLTEDSEYSAPASRFTAGYGCSDLRLLDALQLPKMSRLRSPRMVISPASSPQFIDRFFLSHLPTSVWIGR
jgi:hypothetical protein